MAGDIAMEYEERFEGKKENLQELYEISDLILPFLFKNGDSIAAVDLLMDIEQLEKLH